MLKKLNKGFTLIEVLVVIGILAVLLAIVIIAINPSKNFASARDTQRQSDVTQILNAIHQYLAEDHTIADVEATAGTITACTTGDSNIGTAVGNIDLGALLVDEFIVDIPIDPDSACDATDTCYTICKGNNNRLTIKSPNAETKTIQVKR